MVGPRDLGFLDFGCEGFWISRSVHLFIQDLDFYILGNIDPGSWDFLSWTNWLFYFSGGSGAIGFQTLRADMKSKNLSEQILVGGKMSIYICTWMYIIYSDAHVFMHMYVHDTWVHEYMYLQDHGRRRET